MDLQIKDKVAIVTGSARGLGAATAEIDWGGKRIVFSGDLGRYDDPMLFDPQPVAEADYVVIESTYGNRTHAPSDAAEALGAVIEKTVGRGGTVVIPALRWAAHNCCSITSGSCARPGAWVRCPSIWTVRWRSTPPGTTTPTIPNTTCPKRYSRRPISTSRAPPAAI